MASAVTKALPQKKYFRQRAHSNPISDHQFDYPVRPEDVNWSTCYPIEKFADPAVRFLDIGCGYGGLLVALSPLFPEKLMLGMEIRVKVQQYVEHRIQALREQNSEGSYDNIAVIRTNAMKYLPNFFQRGQIEKMFFLYPDPHFKRSKYKWRIINDTLLAEYAYVLAENARVYTVTDVEELHIWMAKHFDEHPLFEAISETELAEDPVANLVMDSTEEGKKVSRNNGSKFIKVFRRIKPKL